MAADSDDEAKAEKLKGLVPKIADGSHVGSVEQRISAEVTREALLRKQERDKKP